MNRQLLSLTLYLHLSGPSYSPSLRRIFAFAILLPVRASVNPPKRIALEGPTRRATAARTWSYVMGLLFCVGALVVAAVAVRVGPTVVDEIGQLWKDPIGLDIPERHDEMPTRHYFTNSEEKVSMLEHALDHIVPAKRPALKSLAEILRKRIREGNSSAIAIHGLLTEEIPSYCNGTWSTSAESKAKVQSLKHRLMHLYRHAGDPAARLRDALDITQKIRLVVDDEEDATVKAMRESDKEIDQTGRGWGSQIAWFASRSRDRADYARLQARRKIHEEILIALMGLDKALSGGWFFWAAAQRAIEDERLMEDVGRLESMVEEGALDEQAAKEILLKVSEVVQETALGKWRERSARKSLIDRGIVE